MEAKKKAVYIKKMTPKAEMKYPFLGEKQSEYQGKPQGWGCTFILDPKNNPEHAKFKDEMDKLTKDLFDREIQNIKRERDEYRIKPWCKKEYDKENNETGRFLFKISTKGSFSVFDAKAVKLTPQQASGIWGGSTGRASLSMKEDVYSAKKTIGFVMYFDKVQVIDIKGKGSMTADDGSCPFGAVEGAEGFKATGDDSPNKESDTDDPPGDY